MDLTKFPEKIIIFLGKHKIFFGVIIPIFLFLILLLFTKNLEISLTVLLNFISIPGFIITIFVLENTEENKRIVNNFLNEIENKELIILENDIKELGNSIYLSDAYFKEITKNKSRYSKEILTFNISINKYIDIYKELESHEKVQDFLRYMRECNTMTLFKDIRTYDSYLKVVRPLYIFICIEIDKKSKARLKKVGDKK